MGLLMNIPTRVRPTLEPVDMPIIAVDMPVMYEDEGQEEMGETEIHNLTVEILRNGIKSHLAGQPQYRVFSDLNVYYHRVDHWAYVSPDTMVVEPARDLGDNVTSYRIGPDGPAPVLTAEVLSRRSFQQQDLTNKPVIYAQLGVSEYILVDVTGMFMPQRLLLKTLHSDGTWIDSQDPDEGVTSRLGFRLVIEPDGLIRVVNASTGERYLRPAEAQAEAQARRLAEERVHELEEELARLRAERRNGKDQGQP
jgi:Uma2 family endonuclease